MVIQKKTDCDQKGVVIRLVTKKMYGGVLFRTYSKLIQKCTTSMAFSCGLTGTWVIMIQRSFIMSSC